MLRNHFDERQTVLEGNFSQNQKKKTTHTHKKTEHIFSTKISREKYKKNPSTTVKTRKIGRYINMYFNIIDIYWGLKSGGYDIILRQTEIVYTVHMIMKNYSNQLYILNVAALQLNRNCAWHFSEISIPFKNCCL